MTGSGTQTVGNRSWSISPGTVCFLPRNNIHAFHKGFGRRPLCLVLELDLRGDSQSPPVRTQHTRADLAQVRVGLSSLFRWRNPERKSIQLRVGAVVLNVLDILLRSIHWLPSDSEPAMPPIVRSLDRALTNIETQELKRTELARHLGYQEDYLNRSLKRACGLTFGEFRSQKRMIKVKSLLEKNLRIGEVAEQCGFADQNYFSRWFKLQTGQTPREWRIHKS
jgi:AraC-like DNA-binding protein